MRREKARKTDEIIKSISDVPQTQAHAAQEPGYPGGREGKEKEKKEHENER